MSYILDALRKSERKRRLGTVPDLLTPQETIVHEQKKRPLWPYMIIVALLLNAVLLFWLVPWNTKKSTIPIQSTSEKQTVMNEQVSPAAELSKTTSQESISDVKKEKSQPKTLSDEISSHNLKQNQSVQAKADVQKKITDEHKSIVENKGSLDIAPPAPTQQPAPVAHVPSEPKPENSNVATIPNKIYTLSELPQSIQQSLPAFSISVFLYADDPNLRTVKINGQMMKEGQYLSAGLKLEEITQNTLIFSYQNYRFRVGLK